MMPVVRIAICAVLISVAGLAQAASDRVALVIGMSDYATIGRLDNTLNDARGVAASLGSIGFDVTLSLDTSAADLRQ